MAPAPPTPPTVPKTGQYCAALASKFGQYEQDPYPDWNQNDSCFVDAFGHHTPDLCGPVSATHVLAGFADWPSVKSGSLVLDAASSQELVAATTEKAIASSMDTGGVNLNFLVVDENLDTGGGTLEMDFHSMYQQDLLSSIFSYGAFSGSINTYYSGFNPSNVTTNTLADPMCQAIWQQNTLADGFDYSKTLFNIQIGFFNIDQITIPTVYPCGGFLGLTQWCNGQIDTGLYTVWYTGGHLMPLTAVNPNNGSVAIDNRQEGWGINWQYFGQESVSIAGVIPIFNKAATMSIPGQLGNTSILLGYNRVALTHSGTCPTGTYVSQSGSTRGTCIQ